MVEVVKTLAGYLNPDVLVENVYVFAVLSVFLCYVWSSFTRKVTPSFNELIR